MANAPHPANSDLPPPSLQDYAPKRDNLGDLPFFQYLLVFSALLGGILPGTAVAYINGQRLRISKHKQRMIVLVGVMGLLLVMLMYYKTAVLQPPWFVAWGRWALLLLDRLIALFAYLIYHYLQRRKILVHEFFGGRSLIASGLVLWLTIYLGFLQWLLTWLILLSAKTLTSVNPG
jgi:hypothetical protein